MEDARVEVRRGLALAVRCRAGSGVPFLLVHGLASNAHTWDGVAAALSDAGHAVVAVDLRGHGRSDKPDDGYDFDSVAGDLADLITVLGLERPIAVGQSWGGNVVLELGAARPDLLRGVAGVDGGLIDLAATYPAWDDCARLLAPPRLAGRPAAGIEAHLRAAHPDWPEEGIQGTLANFELRPDGTVAPWLTYERHMRVLRALWEHRPMERLAAYPLPLLLMPVDVADARSAVKRSNVATATALAPRVGVRWFPGADHDVHVQRPADVAATLLEALADGFFG